MGCRTTQAFVGLGIGSGRCRGGFAENSSIINTPSLNPVRPVLSGRDQASL